MKRWMFRIVLCLLLGVATTVGVAWALALWATVGMPDVPEFPDEPPPEVESLVPDDWLTMPSNYGYTVLMYQEQTGFGQAVIEFGVNYTNLFEAVYDISPNRILQIERSGWPFFAVGCEGKVNLGDYDSNKAAPVWSGGFAAPSWWKPAEFQQAFWNRANARPVPYRPILPGFIINTLFYAVIWFGLFFGITSARIAIRYKRGQCVKCAYDLRGTPEGETRCPECGWNSPLHAAASTTSGIT